MGDHQTTNVIDQLQPYIKGLQPSGSGNYAGYCPLHGETPGRSTPSFSVHGGTGLWNCFAGCGGGTLRSLLLRLVNNDKEQVGRILHLIGPLEEARDRTMTIRGPDPFLAPWKLPESMLGLWDYSPDPLIKEGFTRETCWEHDVGIDLEHKRMTFPIRDIYGNLAGVSGRDLTGQSQIRYKVYKQEIRSLLHLPDYDFHNRDYLWRADKVYASLMEDRYGVLILTEGFKAAMWVAQAGYRNVVALMGSSITMLQARLVRRMAGTVFVLLDNDSAGRQGTYKICRELSGMRVFPIEYPDHYSQPSDIPVQRLHDLMPPLTQSMRA